MSNSDCMKIIENLKESISKNDSKIILESLEFLNTFEMTKNILQSSKVGLTINKLRENKNKEISENAAKILEKWRKQFPSNKNKLNNSNNDIQINNNTNKSPNGKNNSNTIEPKKKLSIESPVLKKITAPTKTNNPTPTKTPPVKKLASKKPPEIPKITGDVKRDRVIHQIKNALDLYPQEKPTTEIEPKNTLLKAQEIEAAILNKMGGLVDSYFQKFRLLLSSLESIDNDCLREKVLVETVSVDNLLEMEEIDLVSPKEKKERLKNYEMSLKASESSTSANHIITDMYKCNNCGQRKISYTQLQIRSADEPMTLFLTCLTCGKKWRK